MPIETCSVDGKSGYRYGESGKCYPHDGTDEGKARAKKKAVQQAVAIGGGTAPKDLSEQDLADAKMKTCSDCKRSKPLARFPEDGRTADGHSGMCVDCRFGSSHAERTFAGELETVDLDGVELLAAGGPYFGTGSPKEGDYFEDDYLKQLATNAETLRGEVDVPIKIGHSRAQRLLKNSGLYTDEMPAAGWVTNQRVAGGKLLGDLKKVPKQIAELIKVGAFRKRSVELSKVKAQDGKDGEELEVVSALALLGAKAPAVRTLNDIVTAYYSDGGPKDYMESTVRLLLADLDNDENLHTVDMAEGDVIWDSENGTTDWQQDLTAALNSSVSPGAGETAMMSQPYWVQDIDQRNMRAIVCDTRANAYWVVPFTLSDDDPVPAPQEAWTLAEQAWVQASKDATTATAAGRENYAQNERDSWDTFSSVAETTEKKGEQKRELSDEQVVEFAKLFGITEDDADKRRAAVVAAFADHAPKVVSETGGGESGGGEGGSGGEGGGTGGEGGGSEGGGTGAGSESTASALSDDDRKLLADARDAISFTDQMKTDRIESNLKACAKMGKIDPKDFPRWRGFMQRDYDLAIETLAGLPINRELFLSFGSDESGEGSESADEAYYRSYAARTGVPVHDRSAA